MKRNYFGLILLTLIIGMANLSNAAIIEGTVGIGSESSPTPEVQPIFRLPFGNFINFDDLDSPSSFSETIALTDEYSGAGVVFSGPNPGDGGGVLNWEGNFGVAGYSPPNFLAFNGNGVYTDGGSPIGPERLDFEGPVTAVSALVGSSSGAGSYLSLDAYDAAGNLVDSSSIILDNVMQELSVEAFAISYVVFGQTGPNVWILDDLGFDFGTVASQKATWSRVKSLFR